MVKLTHTWKFDTEEEKEEFVLAKGEFVSTINHRGLTKPSDFWYIAAIHASAMLKFVKATDLNKSSMESKNPRDMSAFLKKLKENDETETLLYV